MDDFQTFHPDNNRAIAYHATSGLSAAPGVLWLGGFRSDMTGAKATYLESRCRARGQGYVRFDYTGHGSSSGRFEDGAIGDWLQDARDVLDNLTDGPQILAGSSMGGWISLLLAQQRPARVKGLLLIAPAPDFTEEVWRDEFSDDDRARVMAEGVFYQPSDYGDPYPLTRRLFDDGRRHLLLHDDINISVPVRIVQGKMDDAVPWQKAEKIRERLASKDVSITYIDDGDHRLSRDEDLEKIGAALDDLNLATGN